MTKRLRVCGLAYVLATAGGCGAGPAPTAPVSNRPATGLWRISTELGETNMFIREGDGPLRIAAEPETRFLFGGYAGPVAPSCPTAHGWLHYGPLSDIQIAADNTFSVDYEMPRVDSSGGRYSASRTFHASGRFDSPTTASGMFRIDHAAMTYTRTDGTRFNVCPADSTGPLAYSRTLSWTATAQ